MAKVQQKSEIITAFGGIFFVLDKFDSILSSVIDSHLGLRSRLIGYQYSEIIRAVFSVFCCVGDCMEDLNLYLKDVLSERPHTRVPSADTVLRGIEKLATENISYTAEKTGNVYDFNTAEKLNQLLVRGIAAYGCPLWNQGHGQGQEFSVQIHRRASQVGQNGKANVILKSEVRFGEIKATQMQRFFDQNANMENKSSSFILTVGDETLNFYKYDE